MLGSSLLIMRTQRYATKMAVRHASVLTCVPAVNTTTATTTATTSPTPTQSSAKSNTASSKHNNPSIARVAQRSTSSHTQQRVSVVSPYDSATSAFGFILSSRTPASNATIDAFANSISTPEARRARAIRANRMLNELESTLSSSYRVLNMLEGRERMLAMQQSPTNYTAVSFDATLSSSSSPGFTTGGAHNGSRGNAGEQDNTNSNEHDNPSSSSDTSDRLVTGSLLALSGLVGYTGYIRRNEVIDMFAEGQSPHHECLPLLCGFER
ncbi:hypothetical protein BDF22DRAFT_741881 [Syncephalis plumigaleata]|nr:hypothetical protein BDF22DRAFT_741881 [Syncephalis plumigaleata]